MRRSLNVSIVHLNAWRSLDLFLVDTLRYQITIDLQLKFALFPGKYFLSTTLNCEVWSIGSSWKMESQVQVLFQISENYSLFYFAGQRWPSWSILNPVDSERLEGDKWSSASMFSQKSPNKEHLSLPGHDVRHPSMILFGIVNDSWIIPR